MVTLQVLSGNESELKDLQEAIHLGAESAPGFGEENGVMVNPIIKADGKMFSASMTIGADNEDNVKMSTNMDNLDIAYGQDELNEEEE